MSTIPAFMKKQQLVSFHVLWTNPKPWTLNLNNYSSLPLKYASRISAQFFWQKSGFIFHCLNISCKVICCVCMNFSRLTFNVNLLTFCWNVSNNRRSSSYICLASVWTLEQSKWSSMSRIVPCRASKPLKWVALLDSTNVLIDWIWSSIGSSSYEVIEACPSTSSLNGKGIEQNQQLCEHPNLYSSGVS